MTRGKTVRVFLSVSMLIACMLIIYPASAEEPKPDPAGIATGTKSDVLDAGGSSFVVSEPTDTKDPDYAKKKTGIRRIPGTGAKKSRSRLNWPTASGMSGSLPTSAGPCSQDTWFSLCRRDSPS